MIQADLLRTLGWSEDLIDEITRTADQIRASSVEGPAVVQVREVLQVESSTSAFADPARLSTSVEFRLK
jgi:hypothetical protein